MSVHISKVKGQTLYTFDQLTPDAQKVAIGQFIQVQRYCVKSLINRHKEIPLHKKISNKISFWRLIYDKGILKVWENSHEHVKDVIKENVCQFLADGTYITYSLK